MSTESERAATRERVRRFRERQRAEAGEAIRKKFEEGIRKFEPTKPEEKVDENLLRECSTAVDVLLEADAFLLWAMYPMEAKALGIPLPMHVTSDNVDDAVAFVEGFASEYEQSPLKSVANPWKHMLRLCLLDGIIFDYGVDGGTAWVRISPGFRDLYRQYRQRLGKSVPNEFVKPATMPTVPRKKVEDLEGRFVSHCLAIDKNFPLLPEGEGVIGQLFAGGRARVVWELMTERDQQALANRVQKEFAGFCE